MAPPEHSSSLCSWCHSRWCRYTWSSNSRHNRFICRTSGMSRRTIRLSHDAPFRDTSFQRTEGIQLFFFSPLSRSLPSVSLFLPLFLLLLFSFLFVIYFERISIAVGVFSCSQWELNSTSFHSQESFSVLFFPRDIRSLWRRDSERYGRIKEKESATMRQERTDAHPVASQPVDLCVFVGTLFIYFPNIPDPVWPEFLKLSWSLDRDRNL